MAGYSKYLAWIGIMFTLIIGYVYKKHLDYIDNLQNRIQKHGSSLDADTGNDRGDA